MFPAWWTTLAIATPLLLLVAVTTLVRQAGRFRSERARARDDGMREAALAAAALLIAVAYLVTPYTALGLRDVPVGVSANVRYLVPALVLSAPLLAVLMTGAGAARAALQLTAVVAVGVGLAKMRIEVATSRQVLATLALGAAAAGAAWVIRDPGWRGLRRPHVLGAIAAAGLVGAVGVGYRVSDRIDASRTRGDATFAWIEANAPSGQRVGVGGVWDLDGPPPVWPVHGPSFGNHVEFVGRLERKQLRRYTRESEWRAAAARFDLIVMGTLPTRELEWAGRAGFTEVARSPRLVLYRTARG